MSSLSMSRSCKSSLSMVPFVWARVESMCQSTDSSSLASMSMLSLSFDPTSMVSAGSMLNSLPCSGPASVNS